MQQKLSGRREGWGGGMGEEVWGRRDGWSRDGGGGMGEEGWGRRDVGGGMGEKGWGSLLNTETSSRNINKEQQELIKYRSIQ